MVRFLSLAAVVALTAPAHAQEADEAIVVTAANAEQPASEVGQSVTVLTRDTIERRQTVAVSDLLATVPGVSVTRNGGIGTVSTVRIRGAEGEHTLVVLDGVRINDPSAPQGAYDFGNLLASSVERIEVLRGPDSVPWGSQAIGGVVNIISERPGETLKVRAHGEAGAFDTFHASGAVSGTAGGFSGALSAGYLRSDGISAAASGTEPDGYRQFGATARAGYEFTNGIGIDLRGYYADSRTEADTFLPVPPYTPTDGPDFSTAQQIAGYAGLYANLAEDRIRNRLALTIADIARDYYDPSIGDEVLYFYRGRSERFEYQGDFRIVEAVRAVVGAEHENSRLNDGFSEYKTHVTGLYGQLIVKPFEVLTVTGGVRNDDYKTFGNHTTFSANAALALASATTIRTSYAEGYRAPSLYELYSFYGNAALQPEEAENVEIGFEQAALDGRLRFGATWFKRDLTNRIDFDFTCNAFDGCYRNIAATRVTGVEAGFTAQPVNGFVVTASYTWLEPENRSLGYAGLDLTRRPRDTWTVSTDYRFGFGLALGGTLLAVGDSFDNAFNTVRNDGYAILGVRAEMPVSERVALYGRVDNVTNERYQTVANYSSPGRSAYAGVRLRFD